MEDSKSKIYRDENNREYQLGADGGKFYRCAGCEGWVKGYRFCYSCFKKGSKPKNDTRRS